MRAIELRKESVVNPSFWMQRVLPVGACHAATLAFGNAQYLYMGIAMIQFLKVMRSLQRRPNIRHTIFENKQGPCAK